VGQVDRGHPTAPEFTLDAVGIGQRGLKARQRVGQTWSGEGRRDQG
jgi:hypothetical protein